MRRRLSGLCLACLVMAPAAGWAAPASAPLAQNRSVPAPATTPGKPVETRRPELVTDRPAFPGQTRAPYTPSKPFRTTVLTDQLQQPWALAFLPSGRMLVTEKPGAMRLVDARGVVSAPIAGVPKVNSQGQVGLLDVQVDPKFAASRLIFFSYSAPVGAANSQIVVARATLDEAGLTLRDVKVIFRARPALPRAMMANQGGRIAIGPDGTLFVMVGDRSRSPPWDVAQRMDNHLGKTVRITPDGAAAPGNPFARRPGALREIWSIGHRSEQGLAFDAAGQLWETEHGPRGGDELNRMLPGRNYGWPVVVHGVDYPGAMINGGLTAKAGLEQPVYYWDPVIAPSGLAFYDADLFPEWKGSVFVGALRGVMLDRLVLKDGKVVGEEPLLVEMKSRFRDVRVGPEGAVYALTDDGKLLKLTPG